MVEKRVTIEDMLRAIDLLVEEKLTREEATFNALSLHNDLEQGCLTFIPPEMEPLIIDSILFLMGIDLKDSPVSYLHNHNDIILYKEKLHKRLNTLGYW